MIKYKKFLLENGLRLIVHEDHSTPMAALNILYDVGAKDEDENMTGFAHLFEHLMFGGSINIPSFDEPLQRVGGENNAFTSNDITNYHIQLPAQNIETAFWLESDRMLSLAFSEKSLEVQRNVVCEEFKQRYLNQPYGDVWLKFRPLIYKQHPYKWATIGKELSHIEDATMAQVKAFFKKHYSPQNAILVITGNIQTEEIHQLAKKWFEPIPAGNKYDRNIAPEPEQTEARYLEIKADVPANAIFIAFHASKRKSNGFYAEDLITDILSRGQSSRFYNKLVKGKELFSELNAHSMGSIESGLILIEGVILPHVSFEDAEKAIWEELELINQEGVSTDELSKVQNKVESATIFSNLNLLEKAYNLAFFELLGSADDFNKEIENYTKVSTDDIQNRAQAIFKRSNSSTLFYKSLNQNV